MLALGQLGADTARWLDDADRAVQAMAALCRQGEARSTVILIAALSQAREVDAWFTRPPPLITSPVRVALLHELLARGVPFADLLPAALSVAEVARAGTADADWGPLLRAAFPDVDVDAGADPGARRAMPSAIDNAQRALLRALVANASLWDPKNFDAVQALGRVGLPADRALVAALAG